MKSNSIFFIVLFLIATGSFSANAQQDSIRLNKANANNEIYQGNQAYEQKDYQAALDQYRQGLERNPQSYPGLFNSGNASYQLQHPDSARTSYEASLAHASGKMEKAQAYHNVGNTYMQQKKWAEAIDAYKNALRQNPNDQDSKYNLAYAQKMLKNNGGGGGKNNQDKKDQDKKDQNKKDQNQKDQDKKDQDKKDQDKQKQDKDDQQDKDQEEQPKSMPSKISEEQADKLLNALRQEEKKLQQQKKGKEKAVPVQLDKDW